MRFCNYSLCLNYVKCTNQLWNYILCRYTAPTVVTIICMSIHMYICMRIINQKKKRKNDLPCACMCIYINCSGYFLRLLLQIFITFSTIRTYFVDCYSLRPFYLLLSFSSRFSFNSFYAYVALGCLHIC